MRKGIMAIAQESIGFQNGNLFKELTEAVSALLGEGTGLNDNAYFKSKKVIDITEVLKKHTGISFKMMNGEHTGPAMMPPKLDANHSFFGNGLKQALIDGVAFDAFSDIRPIIDSMEDKIINGTVDLKNSRISGAFEKLTIDLYMPRSIFVKNGLMSAAEIAAIILHETGHAFTFMEFISRTVTTNQALAGMIRATDKSMPSDKREVIFAKGISLLRMNNEQRHAILNAKSKNEVTVIVMDSAVQLSVSELGKSIYDVNSCEYLADQFATRHGAGRELVTALDKFMRHGRWRKSTAGDMIIRACNIVIAIFMIIYATAATFGAIWLIFILMLPWMSNKESAIYDNEKSRFLRIKQQNIERLKDKYISVEEKISLISSNETIDIISKHYNDNLVFVEKIAYYLRPSYRNAHKFEILQKDLERIGSSDLFTHAAKLSTL